LPTIQELNSLIEPGQFAPALPAGHPFGNVQLVSYWSASSSTDIATYAWAAIFLSGYSIEGDKSNNNYVWCVRGGAGPDAQ
jgi:hypothetical protein